MALSIERIEKVTIHLDNEKFIELLIDRDTPNVRINWLEERDSEELSPAELFEIGQIFQTISEELSK